MIGKKTQQSKKIKQKALESNKQTNKAPWESHLKYMTPWSIHGNKQSRCHPTWSLQWTLKESVIKEVHSWEILFVFHKGIFSFSY